MRVVDNQVLMAFRCKTNCEICGKPSRAGLDPMHVFARGRGNAFQMDMRENLVAGCRACHCKHHSGQITRAELLEIVSRREGRPAAEIDAELRRLRWQKE